MYTLLRTAVYLLDGLYTYAGTVLQKYCVHAFLLPDDSME